jgi:hypothetical protein
MPTGAISNLSTVLAAAERGTEDNSHIVYVAAMEITRIRYPVLRYTGCSRAEARASRNYWQPPVTPAAAWLERRR